MKTISHAEWPDCAIKNCPNKACIVLDSLYCFPHTSGNTSIKSMKIDAHRTDMKHGTYIKDNG